MQLMKAKRVMCRSTDLFSFFPYVADVIAYSTFLSSAISKLFVIFCLSPILSFVRIEQIFILDFKWFTTFGSINKKINNDKRSFV